MISLAFLKPLFKTGYVAMIINLSRRGREARAGLCESWHEILATNNAFATVAMRLNVGINLTSLASRRLAYTILSCRIS